jgi:hypothetical protein
MRLSRRLGVMIVTLVMGITLLATGNAGASPAAQSNIDCPPGVKCQVVLAALKDGGCNWSQANRPTDLPVYGINVHTTEGTLAQALAEAQDTSSCISWNYLIAPDGTVYVSVPANSLAYDVGNWWFNTHYIQVEHIGRAEDCSSITPAEYNASTALNRYLIPRFHILPTADAVTGHDSVPGVKDADMPKRHWDPGVCFPWVRYLSDSGVQILPTAGPNSSVITIRTDNSNQPVQNCNGANPDGSPAFTACTPPAQPTTNFVALYTAPSISAPLLSDPYLHADGLPGTTAMQDWGDKAPTGHAYTVLSRKPGWTQIQYGGTSAWFQDNGHVSVPTTALTITPKGNAPIGVYGRPMPEGSAPGWSQIPYDLQTQVALTKYVIQPGQRYPVALVPSPRTDYAEGCNVADCSGPGDRTVVIGQTKYVEVSFNHFRAFVRADDVIFGLN